MISLSLAIAASITSLSTKTQHITADGDRTQIDGTLVIHGPFLGQGDIGTSESPFSTVYASNIITPSTNLNALATTVSNHTSSIIELQKGPMTLLDLQENILYHFDSELVLAQQTFTVPVTLNRFEFDIQMGQLHESKPLYSTHRRQCFSMRRQRFNSSIPQPH